MYCVLSAVSLGFHLQLLLFVCLFNLTPLPFVRITPTLKHSMRKTVALATCLIILVVSANLESS